MKKRVLAVLLSLSMCMATVVEAGAAAFDSSVSEETAALAETDAADATEQEEEPIAQETLDTETVTPEAQDTQEEIPAEETPAADGFGDGDLFTSGTTETPAPTEIPVQNVNGEQTAPVAAGTVVVTEDDWVVNGTKFMLEKDVPQALNTEVTPTEAPAAEKPQEDSQEADTEETGEAPEVLEPETPEVAAQSAEEASVTEEIPEVPAETQETEVPTEEVPTEEVPTEEVPTEEAQVTEVPAAEEAAVDKNLYYTDEDGIVTIYTEYNGKVYSGAYLFDEKGCMVTGTQLVKTGTKGYSLDTDQELFFADSASAVPNEGCETEEVTPWTSNLGKQQVNTWVWDGTVYKYYDAEGKLVTVDELNDAAKTAGTYTGYFKIGEEYYCLKSDGTPRTGNVTITIDGKAAKYYFQTAEEASSTVPGRMFHEGWRTFTGTKGERWIYYNQGVTTPANIGKALERGIVATTLDVSVKGDSTYLIDKYGYIIKSTMKKAENGAYYCTDKNGVIYKEKLVKYNGYRYYFGSNGKRVSWKNCWHTCPGAGDHMYYFGSTAGRVVEKTGWQKVTTAAGSFYGWFYFNKSGNNYMNKLTTTGYYFNAKGKLAGGVNTIGNKKYFFEVSDSKTHRGKMLKSSLIYHKNKWFYASSTGALRKTGWQKVSGSYYYFSDYRAVTKKFIQHGSTYGYLNSQGKFCTGWVIISNSKNLVRYINPDAPGFLKSTNRVIDGLRYYFDANGYRINDLTGTYGGPYYVKVDRVNCTMTVYNSARTVPVKTIRVSVGLAGTATPLGTYTLARSARWQALMGPSWGQYGTHVEGAGQGGIFVHSVSGSYANSYSLPAGEYNKLGTPASHGCIRVCVADAKWVYDNCNGATITIFDGKYTANEAMRGPLGRRALVPLKSPYNYDPTDPNI